MTVRSHLGTLRRAEQTVTQTPMAVHALKQAIQEAAFGQRLPVVMGVLNVTPDSFSDGGQYLGLKQAIEAAQRMWEEGAELIDVGGESTRPGAEPVSAEAELARVIPVIEALVHKHGHAVSVDTSQPKVMQAALEAGAVMVNDVRALTVPGALAMVASHEALLCLMHMQGTPQSMQTSPSYQDPVAEISQWLGERAESAKRAGINADRLLLDPGFGFGKTVAHNYQILARLAELRALGCPLLAGLSRKSMLGAVTGREAPQARVAASVAGALLAAQAGAAVLRVHDVAETCDALAVWKATRDGLIGEG